MDGLEFAPTVKAEGSKGHAVGHRSTIADARIAANLPDEALILSGGGTGPVKPRQPTQAHGANA
jgi:hypothetical protein